MTTKELEFLCAFARCNALDNKEFNEVMSQYGEFMEYVEWVCKGNAFACNTDENEEFDKFMKIYISDYKIVEKEGFLGECALVCHGNPTLTIIEFDLN